MLGRTDKLLQDTRIRRNSNATALQQVPPQFLRSAPRLMPAQSHTLPNAMVMYNKYNTAVCLLLQLRLDGSRGTVGAS
jgi:hypothetical protein